MKVTREDHPRRMVTVTVEVEPELINKEKDQALRRLARGLRLPGFRPGKAPLEMVRRNVSESELTREALDRMLPTLLQAAIEESGAEPYDLESLEIEIVSEEPLQIGFSYPMTPTIELADLDLVDVEANEITIEDEQIDEMLESLRASRAVWEPALGPVEYGDQVIIDLRGDLMDGTTVVDETGLERVVQKVEPEADSAEDEADDEADDEDGAADESGDVASDEQDAPVETIDDQLVGMMVNQVKEFPIVYPDDMDDPQIAGRTVLYRATLHELKKQVLPELDDEFAAELAQDGVDTLEALRGRLHDNLLAEAEDNEFNRVVNEILDALADESEIDYPDRMVQHEVDRRVERFGNQLQQYGMKLENYFEMLGIELEDLENQYWDDAEQFVRRSLTLSKYIEVHEVTLTDEERERELDLVLHAYAPAARGTLRQRLLSDENAMREISERLLARKAAFELYATVTGEDAPPLFPELEEPEEEEGDEEDEDGGFVEAQVEETLEGDDAEDAVESDVADEAGESVDDGDEQDVDPEPVAEESDE